MPGQVFGDGAAGALRGFPRREARRDRAKQSAEKAPPSGAMLSGVTLWEKSRREEMAGRVTEYMISRHAALQMQRRGLDEAIVRSVLLTPGQREVVRSGRVVMQSRVEFPNGIYIVRVFVDIDRCPAEVVTAYRTNKIEKYWRSEP